MRAVCSALPVTAVPGLCYTRTRRNRIFSGSREKNLETGARPVRNNERNRVPQTRGFDDRITRPSTFQEVERIRQQRRGLEKVLMTRPTVRNTRACGYMMIIIIRALVTGKTNDLPGALRRAYDAQDRRRRKKYKLSRRDFRAKRFISFVSAAGNRACYKC